MRAYPHLESPVQRMRKLNADGEAYCLENILFANGSYYKRATVHSIGSHWIEIQDEGSDETVWVNLNHIISVKIVEV